MLRAVGITRADEHNLKKKAGYIFMCRDGYVYTAPAGSYRSNGFGLHDMLGNVLEWVEDCPNRSYRGAPTEGSAWTTGHCSLGILRGGSWYNLPMYIRAANRYWGSPGFRDLNSGFRVARTN